MESRYPDENQEIEIYTKKTERIKDDNFNLSFVKISKNLNLGQKMKKTTLRAFASRANKSCRGNKLLLNWENSP